MIEVGNMPGVARYADQLLLRGVLGLSDATVAALQAGAEILANRRRTR